MLERAGWDRLSRVSGIELRVPCELDPAWLRRESSALEEQIEPFAIRHDGAGHLELRPAQKTTKTRRRIRFNATATCALFRHEIGALGAGERLAIAWNLAVPGHGRLEIDGQELMVFDGGSAGLVRGGPCREIMLRRPPGACSVRFRSSCPMEMAGFVIETILRSEGGFESVIQGIALFLAPALGARRIALELRLEEPQS